MRINKNTNHTKRNIIVTSVIALAVVAGGWYYLSTSNAQTPGENTVSYEPATDEQLDGGLTAKEKFNNTHYNTSNDKELDNTTTHAVGVVISSMNQNNTTLTIASTVETIEEGVCDLSLSREGSNTVTAQVKAIKITTYTACEDFIVDVAGLEKGEWNIKVSYTGQSSKGETSGKVSIK